MQMFKEATRLKLRFTTEKGVLNIEQVWDLKLQDLDTLAVSLEEEVSQTSRKSFLETKSDEDKISKLKFDIVLEVLNTKLEERKEHSNALEAKKHNQKILEIIKEKEDSSLKDMSIDELKKMIK